MVGCERIAELLSAELDGELGSDGAATVADHLGHCAACRAERDHLARVRSLVRSLPTRRAPESVRAALTEAAGDRAVTGRSRRLAAATALLAATVAGGALGMAATADPGAPVAVDALVSEHLTVSAPATSEVSPNR